MVHLGKTGRKCLSLDPLNPQLAAAWLYHGYLGCSSAGVRRGELCLSGNCHWAYVCVTLCFCCVYVPPLPLGVPLPFCFGMEYLRQLPMKCPSYQSNFCREAFFCHVALQQL